MSSKLTRRRLLAVLFGVPVASALSAQAAPVQAALTPQQQFIFKEFSARAYDSSSPGLYDVTTIPAGERSVSYVNGGIVGSSYPRCWDKVT